MDDEHNKKLQWIHEQLDDLLEDLTQSPKPGSRPGSLKRKAAQYLGKGAGDKLSKTDLKRLRAKANKMKKSTKKSRKRQRQSTVKTS